jgi:hypothetical protein
MGTGKIQRKMQKIGAEKDKNTEKRHFPMDFFTNLLIIQFYLYTNKLQTNKME